MLSDLTFWQGKRVLLTGHSGFKGGWLTLWLQHLGAHVTGISLVPNTIPNLFGLAKIHNLCDNHFCDIRNAEELSAIIRNAKPEVIFHLAAQPLVSRSYWEPIETFGTNIMGTAHVLDALRGLESVKTVVMVTTDKVYRNNEWHLPYREEDILGGHDPYSASKSASEIVIASFRDSFLAAQGIAVASARAGNVIGGGDWSSDRLIPDAVRAWQTGATLEIRRPDATRPWQHVLEPISGYLTLAEKLWCQPELAGAFNFGPYTHEAATVRELVFMAQQSFGEGEVQFGNCGAGPHEAGWLALETSKVRMKLGLQPKWSLSESVARTMNWYRAQNKGADARQLCLAEIDDYVKAHRMIFS
jgi:CDP-glucose 4,6-dehydratase